MKNYTKDTIQSASNEQLTVWLTSLRELVQVGTIEFVTSKGELISCPWNVFNGGGAVVASRETDPLGWDLGRRVQMRAEAERQHSGNVIASFKAALHAKSNSLTATVRSTGLKRSNCPTMDQLQEAQSVLGNISKITRELFDRAEAARLADALNEDRKALAEMDAERRHVAKEIKDRAEAAKKAVKDAFEKNKNKNKNAPAETTETPVEVVREPAAAAA